MIASDRTVMSNGHAPVARDPHHDAYCKGCGLQLESRGASGLTPAQHQIFSRLSEAQQRVLAYLLAGLTEPQIAQKIDRSRHTVHDHTKAIYAVTGVQRRVQLVLLFSGVDGAALLPREEPSAPAVNGSHEGF